MSLHVDREKELALFQAMLEGQRAERILLAKYEAARGRYEEALRMFESFLPAGHPNIEAVRDKLGEV